MLRRSLLSPTSSRRIARKSMIPACENLESRLVLSTISSTAEFHSALVGHIRALQQSTTAKGPILGTISGQVTNASSGKGTKNVKVQLIDSAGNLAQTVSTNNRGFYNFKIRANGAYVVREVVPRKFVQATPTFVNAAPVGELNPPPNSYSYDTGNSNPANGPVGPYF